MVKTTTELSYLVPEGKTYGSALRVGTRGAQAQSGRWHFDSKVGVGVGKGECVMHFWRCLTVLQIKGTVLGD